MARWKLTEPHYIKLAEETRWEYVEVERVTGRPKRTQFVVPRFLNPLDPADWTETRVKNEDGDIIVSNGNNAQPKDLIFHGEPTPGMLPLDDEAKQISSKYDWTPTQGLDEASQADSYTNKLLGGLLDQITDVKVKVQQQAPPPGFDELLKTLGAIVQQNQVILQTMATQQPKVAARPLR